MGEPRDFVFYTLTYHSKSHPAEEKSSLKGAWSGSADPFLNFTPHVKSPQRLMLESSYFVHGSPMRSLSLVMSECSLSGRGHGHVSNFYVVDLESLATASRRYIGDIHNSIVVGLFMTPIRQRKRLGRVMVECTCLLSFLYLSGITPIKTRRPQSATDCL